MEIIVAPCLDISNVYCQTPTSTGNGTDVQSRIGKTFRYKDTLDYVCKQGYIYNNSISRRHLVCDLHNGSNYVTWNGTELICSSKCLVSAFFSSLLGGELAAPAPRLPERDRSSPLLGDLIFLSLSIALQCYHHTYLLGVHNYM